MASSKSYHVALYVIEEFMNTKEFQIATKAEVTLNGKTDISWLHKVH